MNLVTPRQRQEWLSRAEDYADIVNRIFFVLHQYFFFLVSSTYEICLTTCRKILFSINIY
jgi:hypothetical protein